MSATSHTSTSPARMLQPTSEDQGEPRGVYTEQELYSILGLIFVAVFFDIDPVKSFPLRQAAKTVALQLGS